MSPLLALLVAGARAADPAFAGADTTGQAVAKPVSRLAAELGGAFTSGNTSTYTLNGAVAFEHRWGRNRGGVDAGANLGRSVVDTDGDGRVGADERAAGWTETARKVWIDARYDRYIGKKGSLYALAGTAVDPFAGYDNRSHAQAGYSRPLLTGPRTSVLGEVGTDVARDDFVAGVEPAEAWIVSVRAMLGLRHAFNESVLFEDRLEVYESVPELADVRVQNTAALTARLGETLSLKLAHVLAYDHAPVEGYAPLDHTTTVTFVASLL